MHRAFVAGRLVLTKPAQIQTLGCIVKEFRALRAQRSRLGIVMCAAIDMNHDADSPFLPGNALRGGGLPALKLNHVFTIHA